MIVWVTKLPYVVLHITIVQQLNTNTHYQNHKRVKVNRAPFLSAAFASVEPTLPRMHSAHFASGLALFLERIGTRSQDWINEGSFAQKVTRFSVNVRQLTRN